MANAIGAPIAQCHFTGQNFGNSGVNDRLRRILISSIIASIKSENLDMRRMITKYPPGSLGSLSASIGPAKQAAALVVRGTGSSEIYEYLTIIYSIYGEWRQQRRTKRSARVLAEAANIPLRKGMSPIRILIDATLPDAHFKQKSRWVRALEYANSERVPTAQFGKFVRAHGGLAGCARLAAMTNEKRRHPVGYWTD
jgi:hypothetical protein